MGAQNRGVHCLVSAPQAEPPQDQLRAPLIPRPPQDAPFELASPAGSPSASFLSFLWVSPSFPWHSPHILSLSSLSGDMGTPNRCTVDLQCVPKGSCVAVLVSSLALQGAGISLTGGVFSRWKLSYWGISLEAIMGHSPFFLLSSEPSFNVLCYYSSSDHGLKPLTLS